MKDAANYQVKPPIKLRLFNYDVKIIYSVNGPVVVTRTNNKEVVEMIFRYLIHEGFLE